MIEQLLAYHRSSGILYKIIVHELQLHYHEDTSNFAMTWQIISVQIVAPSPLGVLQALPP